MKLRGSAVRVGEVHMVDCPQHVLPERLRPSAPQRHADMAKVQANSGSHVEDGPGCLTETSLLQREREGFELHRDRGRIRKAALLKPPGNTCGKKLGRRRELASGGEASVPDQDPRRAHGGGHPQMKSELATGLP